MRKFYQLVRIDLNMIEDQNNDKAIPVYIPVDPSRPEFSLGYFSSKRKVLDRLIEIQPKVMKKGVLGKPFYSGYNNRGRWEGWLIHDPLFTRALCYMILEIEAE